jgi:glucose-1-phosphate adenylyltransferase
LCRINSFAQVEGSILCEGVTIGRYARVKNAIIDKGVQIPPGVEIGYDLEADAARGFTVTDRGIVVIAKADGIEHLGLSDRTEHRPHMFSGTRSRNMNS